jgi:hypothetical protein
MKPKKRVIGFILLEFMLAASIGLLIISLCMYSMYRIMPAYDAFLIDGRFFVEDCCMIEQLSEFLTAIESSQGVVLTISKQTSTLWQCADGVHRCVKKRGNILYSEVGPASAAPQQWKPTQKKILGVCTSLCIDRGSSESNAFVRIAIVGKSKKQFVILCRG